MQRPGHRAGVRGLLAECAREADSSLALLRILLALLLGLVLLVATLAPGAAGPLLETREVFLGAGLVALYLLVGLLAYLAAGRPVAERARSWLLAVLDSAFLLASVALLLRATALPANLVAVFPMLWLAPLFLVFAAARHDGWLVLFQLVLLALGLPLAMLGSGAWVMDLEGVAPPPYDLFFSLAPNVLRFLALMAAGILLFAATRRIERVFALTAATAERKAEARAFLPPRLVSTLPSEQLEALTRGCRLEVALALVEVRGLGDRRPAPPELLQALGDFEARLAAAAERRGGLLLRQGGARVLAVFGLAGELPEAARAALAFARDLRAPVPAILPPPLVALASGELDLLPLAGPLGPLLPVGPALAAGERLARDAQAGGRGLVASSALLDLAGELPSGLDRFEIEVPLVEGPRPVELHSRPSVA